MATYLMKAAVSALILVAAAGCSAEDKNPDTGSAVRAGASGVAVTGAVAGGSDLRWRNDAYRELDGDDENAERLVVTVSKAPLDSTMVRLEIRTSKDGLLYRHEWPAVAYVAYGEPGSAKDSALVLRATQREIAKIFQDSAFISGAAVARYTGHDTEHEAIRFDIAERDLRASRSLGRWDPLPPGAYDELNTFARAVPLARVQTVAAETRNMPAFKYYGGGEETYVIAWSTSEGRMVRIAACC